MQGKVVGTSLVIMDSFALPVQGTETRVNAANEANEYMVQYIASCERVRRHPCGLLVELTRANCHTFSAGWASRERDRLVPLASWVWVLALWYRRFDPDDEPAVPRPLRRRRGSWYLLAPSEAVVILRKYVDRPQSDHFCWEGRYRRFPNVPRGLQAANYRQAR